MVMNLLIIPLVGIVSVTVINQMNTGMNRTKGELAKLVGLITSLLNFGYCIYLWSRFDSDYTGYQFIYKFEAISFYPMNFGIDGISLYFVLLTCFLLPIVFLSSWYSINHSEVKYVVIILLLESFLLAVFLVLDLIMFYIFFETILPPLFLLIGIWGSKRRVRASFHLFLYTLGGSLFMLLAFLTILFVAGSTDYQYLENQVFDIRLQKILWLAIFLSIMVKSPLWPFHLWLPVCHSEAPLGGSILLAGVILKLALYAVLRILLPFLPEASYYFTPLVYSICLVTIIYASLTTLRQIDVKVLVAYSSISHMAVTMMGAFSNQIMGIQASILMGVAHGLVSPALFILLGGVLYDRYHTRVISYYRGLTQFMPIFSVMLFLFTLANMGTPLTANFLGEFFCLAGAFERSPILGGISSLSIILSAVYSIFLYNRITGGVKSKYIRIEKDIDRRELFILLPLLILVFVLGIYPNIILEHLKISELIYHLPS